MSESIPQEGVAEASTKRKRSPVVLIIVVIAALVGLIYGFRVWSFNQVHASTDDAQVTATIDQVSPQVAGNIRRVLVVDNEVVQRGQLLAEIDPASYETAVERARANLALAVAQAKQSRVNVSLTGQVGNAGIQQALGQVNQTEGAIAGSQADVIKAEAGVASARAAASGARSGAMGSVAALQSARVNVAKANEAVRQANALVASAEAGVRGAAATVASAQATVDRASRDADRARTLLKEGVISAQAADQAITQLTVSQAQLQNALEAARAAASLVDQRKAEAATAVAQVAASEALVRQAQAQVQASKDQVSAADQGIRQAQAQVSVARTGVVQASAKKESASGTLAQANAAPTQVEISKVQTEQADAQVKLAQAALDAALLDLKRTKIYAPATGQVSRKTVTVGAQVQPGTPLMAIVPEHSVYVIANFKETQLSNIRVGQPVEVEIDSFPGEYLSATVDSLSAGTGSTFALLPPDNSTGNFTKVVQRVPVKIVFKEGQDRLKDLRAGMSAVVTVDTAGAKK